MKRRFVGAAMLSALMLAGCDIAYGIRRSSNVAGPIDWDCVETAVRSAGLGDVSRASNPSGNKALASTYIFYEAPGTSGVIVQSGVDADGDDWAQYYWTFSEPVSSETVANLRVAMVAVEQVVSARCGVGFENIKEIVRTNRGSDR